ncbi:MAG: hypothetical protein J5I98_19515 [Phaeodactylibacter sp.]|nr:hypothetical protein [Phaeodactylibacter sp.]
MKKPSDALFRLAKAMTPSEKRYFHQYARRHVIGGQNNYLALFLLLSKQEAYDEEALKEALPGPAQKRHFPVLKRQLYQLLLDCLGQYHRNAHPAERAKRKIQAAAILREKGLPGEARQELKSARKLISSYQLFLHLPELLHLEKSLLEREASRLSGTRELDRWAEEWRETLDTLGQEGRFAYYNLLLAKRQFQKVSLADEKEKASILEIIGSDGFRQGRNARSLQARMDYFRALATYHFMAGEPEQALACNQALLNLLEENPFLRELYPSRYVAALNNFLIDNYQVKNWEAVEQGLAKLRSLPGQPAFARIKGLRQKIFEQGALLELNMLISRKKHGQARQKASSTEEGLARFSARMALHNRLTIQYLLAYIYFLNRDFSRSLDCLNAMLQSQQKGLLEELFRFARLLQLLLHHELGNDELLPYLIASARRAHQGLAPAYEAENLLFDVLRRLGNAAGRKEKKEIFFVLKEKIKAEGLAEKEARFFEYLDIAHWAGKRS